MSALAPVYHPSRCVRYRYRYSECTRCADACPHDAIRLSQEGAALEFSRCRHCGLCACACRTSAFEVDGFARVEQLKRAAGKKQFSFACAPSECAADAVVPCLGAIDAPTLAYLAWRGVSVELRGSGYCARCEHGERGAAQLATNLEALAALKPTNAARPWTPPAVRDETGPGSDGKPRARPERRHLFRRLAGRGLDRALQAGGEKPVPAQAIRSGAWYVPEPRELLQLVCRPDDGTSLPAGTDEALPLMDLELLAGCTACEACARACPTGALQVREEQAHWSLRFEFERCSGCAVCLEICQPRALQARPDFSTAPRAPVELHRLTKQRCQRCDRFFVSAQLAQTCAVCSDDEQVFAAIFG